MENETMYERASVINKLAFRLLHESPRSAAQAECFSFV